LEDKIGDICFESHEHFMKIAVRQIVQNWLREADDNEVAAARQFSVSSG